MDLIESTIEGVKDEERLWAEEGIPDEPRRAEGQVGDYAVTIRLMSYDDPDKYACNLFTEAHPVKKSEHETVPMHITSQPYERYESGKERFEGLVEAYQLDLKTP